MDAKELGKRIQSERKKRGLTQEYVEARIPLAQKAMTRIEAGERVPSTLELAKLAELFHISIGELFKDNVADEDPLIALYRAAPGLERNHAIQEEVSRCVLLCKEGITLERLLEQPARQRVLFSAFEKPSTVIEAIRQGEMAAKAERRRLGIGAIPIRNMEELLSSQGIWCAATHLPPEMSGLFLYRPSVGMVILVNATHVSSRQRFSSAHEYAHALFDADHPVLISDSKNAADLIEKRANAFAAAFLLPEEGIAELLHSINKGHASRTSFAIPDVSTQEVIEVEDRHIAKDQKLSPQDIAFIAHIFGVSYQAAVYRLHSLNYLSQSAREKLLNQESGGRNYLFLFGLEDEQKKNKPLQCELRIYITRLVIEAYRQEKISRGRVLELCKLLNLSPHDLIALSQDE
jgi:Zn-dependent peptidase ImmA (M78 family)/DNA-binding XRE family transcriptional regulator